MNGGGSSEGNCNNGRFERRKKKKNLIFFFSSRIRHTISGCGWSSDVCSSDMDNLNVTQDDCTEEGIKDLNQKKEDAKLAWEEAHEADIDAHLSYLTWVTAGKTILVMMIVYAAFYGIAGFYNSIQPDRKIVV